MVELPTLLSDEVKFNGSTLKIVTDFKEQNEYADGKYLYGLVSKIRKDPKDKKAMQEYTTALATHEKRQMGETKEVNESRQARRTGVLFKKPELARPNNGWDYKCKLDCEVGDQVFWDAYYTKEQIEGGEADDKLINCEGKLYLMVPSNAMFCAKRGDEFISLNGFVIGEIIAAEDKVGNIHIIQKHDVVMVKTVSVPINLPEYTDPEVWANTEVKKGEIVHCKAHFATPLDATIASETKLVRVAIRTILAIEDEN